MNDTAFLERSALPVAQPDRPRPWLTTANAPAIRIPATAANRTRLRELRARELRLWEAADYRRPELRTTLPAPGRDHEASVILYVLGGIACAALAQSAGAITNFVAQWETFRELVTALVR